MSPGQRAFEFLRQLRGDVKRQYTISQIKRLQERESREFLRRHGPIRKIEHLNPNPRRKTNAKDTRT